MTEGTIALDANILLHLYRLGEHQRKEVLAVLTKDEVRSRLWLPYQVGLEYQRNRDKVAYDQSKVYDALDAAVQGLLNTAEEKIKAAIRDANVREEALEPLAAAREAVQQRLKELGARHVIDYSAIQRHDPVRVALDAIFSDANQVGTKPEQQTLNERIAESKKRYIDEVPPGYLDSKDKDRPEGDYLIWCELLDFAADSGRALLFVTTLSVNLV
ncbi:PIN-like domain-containing protein [Rhodococcus opacus]|uniref:PIN-like domain-containing protein n=1 Tax=Rhodococcus opacus TaxID=37919 RepID=A0AAX3YTT7_RHOOP|nr:PIN domain-containing protein [Rhodococcus opacus]WLF51559.1 PIN-like domain-containing protein [Rhodococcus opacus]